MVCCPKTAINFRKEARHKIEIQIPSRTFNEIGSFTNTWFIETNPWAIIKPNNGTEPFLNEQLQSKVSARMWIRYQNVLSNTAEAAKRRIQFEDRLYDILAIKNLDTDLKNEGNRYQEIICVENNTNLVATVNVVDGSDNVIDGVDNVVD